MSSGALSGVQVACELAEMGAHMVEARFRREHPDASDPGSRRPRWPMVDRSTGRSRRRCGRHRTVNALERSLHTIVGHLRRLDRRFALVGGLAVSARAEPRLTRDADLAVAVSDDHDAEALVLDLRATGYEVAASVEQEATGRPATIRLLPRDPADPLVTDLLFASSGIEEEIVTEADDIVVFAGLSVPVATVGHLIAMKLPPRDDRRRPAHADDLRALAVVAQDDDWVQARAAVELIMERGFAPERDLVTALDALRHDGAY